MAADKDTIYIDIDDEITGIIDKLKASDGKIVALVLPKRASVFQSIVNMKLLKRAADASKKNAVLITSEASLISLAGAAGLHIAKTLTSKPEIPLAPSMAEEAEETVNESEADGEPIINPDQSVGELAGAAMAPPVDNGVETIALDDEDLPPESPAQPAGPKKFDPPKPKKDKKLKIPDFNRFRLFLILGVLLLIILIGGFIFANSSLNKATIDIKTDATNVNVNQDVDLSTSTDSSKTNDNGSTLSAKLEQLQKTYSQQVPTTGQKNNGNKASGTITASAGSCGATAPADVPAGTGVSSNNETYITQDDMTFQPALHGKSCTFEGTDASTGQSNVPILAQSGGASYNTPSGSSFSVAGRSDVAATGSASGGTDDIVQSVNQNDINNAKAKISTNDNSAKQTLESQAKADGYYPITATFSSGTPNITNSANVGDVASTVTVTEIITYTIFGVHQSDLNSLLNGNIQSQIDTAKQSILDNGLSNASFNVSAQSATGATLVVTTKAVVGPELNASAIKIAAEGQKAGAIQSQLSNNPDVTSVKVHFSPFWVSSAPKNTNRITLNIAKPTTTQSGNSND
jgi:cytoskeletal protein RodZ